MRRTRTRPPPHVGPPRIESSIAVNGSLALGHTDSGIRLPVPIGCKFLVRSAY